ncbi:hypothetical protein N7462_000700 [Penicillium macrosclerotiorum]|uniref:uncharacterized protein n=1 Tax=Penicillium macrosclerotiorum TaxID=303699 RepID=UPI0025468D5E|nr:uncharacterized protein N7462_000700 [Penicillium macrosclerotiorum]KAJ5698695.1 hypothetical protein N7462_000700 [Penicillium macrosclerotiorum]
MPFELQVADPADAPNRAEVFFAAFSDDFNRTMFPVNPDVHAWMIKNMLGGDNFAQHEVFLKVTDLSNPEVPVAFAKWRRPLSSSGADQESHPETPMQWPVSSDNELCDRFFGRMDRDHGELMKDRPHYYLEMLAVHPSYQGRGLASKLLKWGLSRADEEGVEVYLSSSPDGKPLYEKYGFQLQDGSFSPFPGYTQVNMIRPIQNS